MQMAYTQIKETESSIIEHTEYGEVGHSTIINILQYDLCYKVLKFYERDLNATSYLETKRYTRKDDKSYILIVMINRKCVLVNKYNENYWTNIHMMLYDLEETLKKEEDEEE